MGVTQRLLPAARVSVAVRGWLWQRWPPWPWPWLCCRWRAWSRYELQYPGVVLHRAGPGGKAGARRCSPASSRALAWLRCSPRSCTTRSGPACGPAARPLARRRSDGSSQPGGGPDNRRHWGGRGPRSASASSASSVASASAAPGGSPGRGSSRRPAHRRGDGGPARRHHGGVVYLLESFAGERTGHSNPAPSHALHDASHHFHPKSFPLTQLGLCPPHLPRSHPLLSPSDIPSFRAPCLTPSWALYRSPDPGKPPSKPTL